MKVGFTYSAKTNGSDHSRNRRNQSRRGESRQCLVHTFTSGSTSAAANDELFHREEARRRATRIVFPPIETRRGYVPYRGDEGKECKSKWRLRPENAGVPSDNGTTNGRNVVEQFPRSEFLRATWRNEESREGSSYCPLSRLASPESLNSFVTLFLDNFDQVK